MKRKIVSIIAIFLMLLTITACSFNDISGYEPTDPIIAAYAKEYSIPYCAYPQELIDLFHSNPETKDFVLQYPILSPQRNPVVITETVTDGSIPLFMQWDTRWGYLPYGDNMTAITGCGPVCLSMATYYLTGDQKYTPDKIIDFADTNGFYSPGNGSSWTLISEGGEQLGFNITELPLDKGVLFHKLRSGIPVICVVGKGDFTTSGHFLVLCAVENGLIKVNDPNSKANSDKLWDYDTIASQVKNLWSVEIK